MKLFLTRHDGVSFTDDLVSAHKLAVITQKINATKLANAKALYADLVAQKTADMALWSAKQINAFATLKNMQLTKAQIAKVEQFKFLIQNCARLSDKSMPRYNGLEQGVVMPNAVPQNLAFIQFNSPIKHGAFSDQKPVYDFFFSNYAWGSQPFNSLVNNVWPEVSLVAASMSKFTASFAPSNPNDLYLIVPEALQPYLNPSVVTLYNLTEFGYIGNTYALIFDWQKIDYVLMVYLLQNNYTTENEVDSPNISWWQGVINTTLSVASFVVLVLSVILTLEAIGAIVDGLLAAESATIEDALISGMDDAIVSGSGAPSFWADVSENGFLSAIETYSQNAIETYSATIWDDLGIPALEDVSANTALKIIKVLEIALSFLSAKPSYSNGIGNSALAPTATEDKGGFVENIDEDLMAPYLDPDYYFNKDNKNAS